MLHGRGPCVGAGLGHADGGADLVVEPRADGELHTRLAEMGQERQSGGGRVGAHQHPPGRDARQLINGRLEDVDVISRRVFAPALRGTSIPASASPVPSPR